MISLAHLVRIHRLPAAALLLLCLLLTLPGLGRTPVTREQELRVLLTARDMAEGGSWLVPHFLNEERLRKPPLMYWLVAAAYRVAGSTESEAAARCVSAGAATLLVLATFLCGRHLVGRESAFLGAIVLATSVGFMRHARLAETDIAQALCTTCAVFAGYAAFTLRRPFPWWLALGVCAGVGFMIKGPASVVMPAAALALYGLTSPRRARFFEAGPVQTLLGILTALVACAAIAAPWYIAVAARVSAQAGDELNRLLGESAHKGPFIYYLYTLPARMGLWAPILPVALYAAFRRWRGHRGFRMVLCWFVSSFVILSTLSSKQAHYALLLFPPAALLVGWALHRAFASPRARFARYVRGCLALLCTLPMLGVAAWGASFFLDLPAAWTNARMAVLPLVLVTALLGIVGLLGRRTPLAPVFCIALSMAVGSSAYAVSLARHFDGDGALADAIDGHREAIRHAPRFLVAGAGSSTVAWHAHRAIEVVTNDPGLAWSAAGPGDVLLVTARKRRTVDVSRVTSAPLVSLRRLDTTVILYRREDAAP